MIPTILWQGEGIRCMKSARTLQYKIAWWKRKKDYPVSEQTEAKWLMTTQTSTARANVERNCISLSDLILRTLMKCLTRKRATNLKGSRRLKYQDSVFIQSNKMWRKKTGARASAPACRKRPARSQEHQSHLERWNITHKNSRHKIDRYQYTICSVQEPIHQSFLLASIPVFTVRKIDKFWSMRKRPFINHQYPTTNFEI